MKITYEKTKQVAKLTADEETGLINNLNHQMKANHVSFDVFEVFVKTNENHDFFSVLVRSVNTKEIFDFEAWRVSKGDYGFESAFNGIYSES